VARPEMVVVDKRLTRTASVGAGCASRIPRSSFVTPGRKPRVRGSARTWASRRRALPSSQCAMPTSWPRRARRGRCWTGFAELGIGGRGARGVVDARRRDLSVGHALQPSNRRRAGATRCSGRGIPTNRFTRRYHERDADPRRRAATSTGCRGASIWLAAQRARLGRRLGRGLLHVRRGGRPVLAAPARRLARRVRAARGRHATWQGASTAHRPVRMIVEHHRSWYRFADRRWRGAAAPPAPRSGRGVPGRAGGPPRRARDRPIRLGLPRRPAERTRRASTIRSRDLAVTCRNPMPQSRTPHEPAGRPAPSTGSRSTAAAVSMGWKRRESRSS